MNITLDKPAEDMLKEEFGVILGLFFLFEPGHDKTYKIMACAPS